MREQALHIIQSFRNTWIRTRWLSDGIYAVAIAFPAILIMHDPGGWSWLVACILIVPSFLFVVMLNKPWAVSNKEVARFFNKQYPELEESSELVLLDDEQLSALQQLQLHRTATAMRSMALPNTYRSIMRPMGFLLVSVLAGTLASVALHHFFSDKNGFAIAQQPGAVAVMPAGLLHADVLITPPAYTHMSARRQSSLHLHAEEGATVRWRLRVAQPASRVVFEFNDSLVVELKKTGTANEWQTEQVMKHSGFYQLRIDTVVSELYRIEIKPDQPPVINIQSPKPNTVIEYGEPEQASVTAQVFDDYGIQGAMIHATVAKGSGEAVSFAAHDIPFPVSFAAQQPQYSLQKLIGLRSLGMQPGDELYFYLTATDNRGQEKRSDIYIVTLPDTATLMSLDGLLNGVNAKPDYFRSQRQIILDAEQLLREKDTAGVESYHNRSNNLGIDQKLLRLRYGKFLGEESSSNEDISGDALDDPSHFGNGDAILDAFTDKHDNAEDAGFLDADTKKQLKAVLTEMWGSELQLRLFKPKEALPFAYKALRLLKDLQQKSRAYVAKTSSKTPPIKLEKRLTGKLDKIIEPSTTVLIPSPVDRQQDLRDALSVLDLCKRENDLNERAIQVLRRASAQVNERAVKEPALYLSAFESLQKIISTIPARQRAPQNDILIAQRAIQQMLPAPFVKPSKSLAPGYSLQDAYFRNLPKNKNR